MKNEELFIERVEDSANRQLLIEEDFKPQMKNLKKMFRWAFGSKSFKLINDCVFYQGENIKEGGEPKLKKILDNIGTVFQFYHLREQEDLINGYLRQKYGIELSVIDKKDTPDITDSGIKKFDKFTELWQEVFHVRYNGENKKQIFDKLLDQGQIVQKDIHDENEVIKNEIADEVESSCEVKKTNFKAAVNLKTIELKKGEDALNDRVNSILEKRQEFDDAIDKLIKEDTHA